MFSIPAKESSVFCIDIIGSDVYLSLNGCWFPLVVVGVEWLYVDSLTRLWARQILFCFCYSNGLALLVVLLVPEEHRLVSEVSVGLQW